MKMKKRAILYLCGLLIAIAQNTAFPFPPSPSPAPPPSGPSFVGNNSSGPVFGLRGTDLGRYVAHELDPTRPDRESLAIPQEAMDLCLQALMRNHYTHAGVDSKETSKSLVPPAGSNDNPYFSSPVFYSSYQYARIQDTLPTIGLDGDQHKGTIGFDFNSIGGTVVGFNFNYTNENLSLSDGGTDLTNSSNSYFFSSYVGKNFEGWVNVGGSFTYGRTDSDFRADTNSVFGPMDFGQFTREDSYALSAFVGISHTFGAWSVASTPSFIWDANRYDFPTPVEDGFGGFGPTGLQSQGRNESSFYWMNNVGYAVSDKLTVTAIGNWTRNVGIEPIVAPGFDELSRGWMTFGSEVEYKFNTQGSAQIRFEHDVFAGHTDNFRLKGGISYSF